MQVLRDAGGWVVEVPADEWTLPADLAAARRLIEATIAGSVQAVTFTSAPAVHNFFLIAQESDVVDLLRTTLDGPAVTICVGPVCAAAAHRCGVRSVRMPPKFRLGPMVQELAGALAAQVRHFRHGGHEVVLRGCVVEVDRERVELTDREASLLGMLTAHPGVPLSKRELLHEVWGERWKDDQVVDVAIGRLRSRLGSCSGLIVAVPRRGYRFEGVAAAA